MFNQTDLPSQQPTTPQPNTMSTPQEPHITLHLRPQTSPPFPSGPGPSSSPSPPPTNPLPRLIQTPSGLAILELQGSFNTPDDNNPDGETEEIEIGNISFPDYRADDVTGSTAWMKRVYMFVGQHQRLLGEVKKLGKPLGVVRKCVRGGGEGEGKGEEGEGEDLEVLEIVKYKIVFSSRPEPRVHGRELDV